MRTRYNHNILDEAIVLTEAPRLTPEQQKEMRRKDRLDKQAKQRFRSQDTNNTGPRTNKGSEDARFNKSTMKKINSKSDKVAHQGYQDWEEKSNRISNKEAGSRQDYNPATWQSKLDANANPKHAEQVVSDFMNQFLNGDKEDIKKVEPLIPYLVREIRYFGFDRSQNPFLQFLEKGLVKHKLNIQPDQWKSIHDLYADGFITGEDLAGTGDDNLANILYVPSLYNQSGNDMEWVIKAYEWFRPENRRWITSARPVINGKEREINSVNDYNGLRNDTDWKRLRNDIIFENGNAKSGVRSRQAIETDMRGLEAKDGRNKANNEKNDWIGQDGEQDKKPAKLNDKQRAMADRLVRYLVSHPNENLYTLDDFHQVFHNKLKEMGADMPANKRVLDAVFNALKKDIRKGPLKGEENK